VGISKKQAIYFRDHFKELSVKIPWRYYKYVFTKYYHFEMYGDTGSAARLFINGDIRFNAHEPHGSEQEFVYKTCRKNAIRAIEMLEARNERGA
jgi:hypothetical protein